MINLSKYLYTPQDIALFLDYCNFKLSDEKFLKENLWDNRNSLIEPRYRKSKYKFFKAISLCRERCEALDYEDEVQVINRILKEIGSSYEITELEKDENYIEAFFRFIKLRLVYIKGCTHVRIKLRTLLRNFGYKRRSETLIKNIKRTMKALGLQYYLKGNKPCDISEVKLDDILVIRLM